MSSLFSARGWWNINGTNQDAFDRGSMCTLTPSGGSAVDDSLIVMGGFGGKLRLYRPRAGGYDPSHLALEVQLDQAILQVATGCFSENGPRDQIAVLHPRKFAVYVVEIGSEGDDQTQESKLVKLHEHILPRTSSNFTYGSFGGAGGSEGGGGGSESKCDGICIQSMDGTLTFLNQDQTGFECFMPGFLVPGPLCYMSGPDSLVTCSASCKVESYRYLSLAAATVKGKSEAHDPAEGEDGDGEGEEAGKRVQVDWSVNIGEHALEIRYCKSTPRSIVVLGERTIFWMSENGTITASKRFESELSACFPYRFDVADVGMLVATHDQTLHVLNNTEIKWAAHMDITPVSLQVATFGGVAGMVVASDDTGKLGCFFLGTDPSMPEITTEGSRDLDYGAMDAEMQALQEVIRDSVLGDPSGPIAGIVQVKHDAPVLSMKGGRGSEKLTVTVQIHIRYAASPAIKDVSVVVEVQDPLIVEKHTFNIASLGGSRPSETLTLTFTAGAGHVPCDLAAIVSVSNVVESEPRTVLHEVELPIQLFVAPAPPSKAAQYKILISTTHDAVDLTSLFRDMMAAAQGNITQTLAGFQLCNGDIVSVQAGKSKARYRIIADAFDAIWVVAKLLIERLESHYHKEPDFQVNFEEQLPLPEYFRLIDEHFDQRVSIAALRKELDSRAHQLRVVQKRLLIRFKDKTPSPLQHLDTLLEATYDDVLFFADRMKEASAFLDVLASRLFAGTRTILMLTQLKFKLDEGDIDVLENALYPRHRQQQCHGWEESAESALRFLLKTSLAKEPKDAGGYGQELSLGVDTSRLKKHIAAVTERLLKGARLRM